MDTDKYITVGGATYKKMVGKKAYHYPITDEKRLVRRDYMRKWRYNKKKNAVDMFLAIESALAEQANPPGYDIKLEQDLFVPTLREPDTAGANGPNC